MKLVFEKGSVIKCDDIASYIQTRQFATSRGISLHPYFTLAKGCYVSLYNGEVYPPNSVSFSRVIRYNDVKDKLN